MIFSLSVSTRFSHHEQLFIVCAEESVRVTKMDHTDATVYLQIEEADKFTQGRLASKLMRIEGVQWVEQIEVLPEQQSREQAEQLFALVPIPVVAIDAQAKVVAHNHSAQEVFGYDCSVGQKVKQLFVAEDWHKRLDQAVASGEAVAIETTAGDMLLQVKQRSDATTGALLAFNAASGVANTLQQQHTPETVLFERSEQMRQLRTRAQSLAAVDAPLLIVGEVGTGTRTLMHVCHQSSVRSAGPFHLIECAGLSIIDQYRLLFNNDPKKHRGRWCFRKKHRRHHRNSEFGLYGLSRTSKNVSMVASTREQTTLDCVCCE